MVWVEIREAVTPEQRGSAMSSAELFQVSLTRLQFLDELLLREKAIDLVAVKHLTQRNLELKAV
jgi:hypothetical protein